MFVRGLKGSVHPIPFCLDHHLSNWPECSLEMHCCTGSVVFPVRLMMRQRGDVTLAAVLEGRN